MTSRTSSRRAETERREHAAAVRRQVEQQERRRRRVVAGVWVAALALVAGLVTGMLVSARPTSSTSAVAAPDFTLTSTSGQSIRLSDYRGRNVVLYFSEGAGCGSCLIQMAQIEKDKAAFDAAGVTVLPVVMNTREQIAADMAQYGVATPFLLDDGRVSSAYGTLGKGMHEGLPGHSFVLVDSQGTKRWQGDFPSMWLAPADLLTKVKANLP